jgi:hypothetical protein
MQFSVSLFEVDSEFDFSCQRTLGCVFSIEEAQSVSTLVPKIFFQKVRYLNVDDVLYCWCERRPS